LQKGFNILALGEPGIGRSTLMLNAMREHAKRQPSVLNDLIVLHQFGATGNPVFLTLAAGDGAALKQAMDGFVRKLTKAIANLLDEKVEEALLVPVKTMIEVALAEIQKQLVVIASTPVLVNHFKALKSELLDYLNAWQPSASADGDAHLEVMLNEAFIGRYRVNVLVSHAENATSPALVDYDPSLQSLFGGIESAGDSSSTPEFMRLRAGNLLKADGGVLLLNLRDILSDEQNGPQILEKLHRFCRNGNLLIEDLSGAGQGASVVNAQAPIPVQVKLVLVATREDYYEMLEDKADFFSFFAIKVEFAEAVNATQAHYDAFALFVANKCADLDGLHFSAAAVTGLLQAMHRLEEDQTRLSTELALLEKLIVESAAVATLDKSPLVELNHVKAAITRRYKRHGYIEGHMRESIVDQELMINVDGQAVGQINGLTHIDLADASFGSPVRISANCYAGSRGVLNIAREVTMSGPTHDKGVMIMQSWLQQHFGEFNPLNFTASLVFEQEYSGVDGDSASCAELFALMSALTRLPINQSIAVTGALNQHGEVLPVGGINDKIEGYYRVCKDIGLTGKQGVLIPKKNQRHLVLSDEIIQAVEKGDFYIATMARVEEGLMYLMQDFMESINQHAAARLQQFKAIIESNRPVETFKK
jgi:predicted ATP-dependent protease